MRNLDAALREANLSVPVTTVVSTEVLGASYPPSSGSFSNSSASTMSSIISFLKSTNSPLLINIYPYFAYASNPSSISLDYALFTSRNPIVQDGDLSYANLFDAIIDAMYSAAEVVAGGPDVKVVVSETGWPSNGSVFATMQNAQIYNNNLVRHVRSNSGTPKRPGVEIETYLFAIFNENGKPAGVEENFGLYWPDMSEVYHVEL
ncbi:uncharacterized protein A4U43_C08F30220 [Asparagus officinalis]|nr:uncharacterized protein A4U43_C08F30220 [Asparagus officinalis]